MSPRSPPRPHVASAVSATKRARPSLASPSRPAIIHGHAQVEAAKVQWCRCTVCLRQSANATPANTPSTARSPRCFIQYAMPALHRHSSSKLCTVTPRAGANGIVSQVSGLKIWNWMSPRTGYPMNIPRCQKGHSPARSVFCRPARSAMKSARKSLATSARPGSARR